MTSRKTLLDLVFRESPPRMNELLAPMVELFTGAREAFGGDLDKFLILTVVAIRAASHPQFARTIAQARAGGPPATPFPSLGVNIQSIADSLGAPKETIRRKVADMVDAGWIERRGNQLHLTALAYQVHEPVRDLMRLMFVRHYETVRDMLAEAGPAAD